MVAIEARHLSKAYRIYAHPKDRLKEYLLQGRRRYHQEFWALRDVNLEIPTGSTFGLIGDNGSGKSTLLQLCAGTLRPSAGSVTTKGRISAILELGAGFNPEFTGRENALMSGAIMGIPAREMKRRLPEVAAFAEIGDFFDRLVKIYSSGMYVRLAFSVATCVDPDILIIDEALSVGDQYFQKRCIDRIEGFRKAGKTVLFCSHSLYQIRMICDQALWLRDGQIAEAGETPRVVGAYENYLRERELPQAPVADLNGAGEGFPWIARLWLSRGDEEIPRDQFLSGEELTVTVLYEVPDPPTPIHVGVSIERNDGVVVFATGTHVAGVIPSACSGLARLRFPRLALLDGEYGVSAFLLDEHGLHVYDRRAQEYSFRVLQKTQSLGLCHLEHRWELEEGGGRQARQALQQASARV